MQGCQVLEFGARSGLVGITAAVLGAHGLMTDVSEVMPISKENIGRKCEVGWGCRGSMKSGILDWRDLLEQVTTSNPNGSQSVQQQPLQHPGTVLCRSSAAAGCPDHTVSTRDFQPADQTCSRTPAANTAAAVLTCYRSTVMPATPIQQWYCRRD